VTVFFQITHFFVPRCFERIVSRGKIWHLNFCFALYLHLNSFYKNENYQKLNWKKAFTESEGWNLKQLDRFQKNLVKFFSVQFSVRMVAIINKRKVIMFFCPDYKLNYIYHLIRKVFNKLFLNRNLQSIFISILRAAFLCFEKEYWTLKFETYFRRLFLQIITFLFSRTLHYRSVERLLLFKI